jgi:hypothetical protein
VPLESERRRIWQEMLACDARELLAAGKPEAARQALEDVLNRFE